MRTTSSPQDSHFHIPAHTATKQRKVYESRREREFYSYYESVLSMADTAPSLCDLNDPKSVAGHRAVSSADKALTAFVQLTALRLQARRSMLFFFDSDHAYILAEATRSLSLVDDSKHKADDALWLGATKIPRGFSVCEATADLPSNNGSNAQDPGSRSIAHIINDLSEDKRFCDRPFVKGGPMARFYAGVPVTTSKGINIGALCVLDDEPRDGVSADDVRFLCDMATTVMGHLEMVGAKSENQRGRDMTTALGAFVEGKSRPEDWWLDSAHSAPQASESGTSAKSKSERNDLGSASKQSSPSKAARNPAFTKASSGKKNAIPHKPVQSKLRHHASGSHLNTTPSQRSKERKADLAMQEVESTDFADQSLAGQSVHAVDDPREDRFAKQIRATMNRAAGLICDAVDMDGVIFLDATIGTFGGQVHSSQGLTESSSSTDASLISGLDELAQGPRLPQTTTHKSRMPSPTKFSPILGLAARSTNGYDADASAQEPQVTEKFLRSLLRRYPEGRVWHFNPDGDASSDDMSEGNLSATSAGESTASDAEVTSTPSSRRTLKKHRTRIRDGRMIQDTFPGVRSLMLVGMWDAHQERWFGASIVWSYSATRILTVRNEISYLAAFCDVVLAEVWRVQAQMVDRSKNDFISSISHELRSPLHGILGSAECLEERESDVVSQELVRSIMACGTTLLDIINQLLQYSRLDNGAQQRHSQMREFSSNLGTSSTTSKSYHPGGLVDLDPGVMLSKLTEDAVNTACSGFEHQGLTPYGTPEPDFEVRAEMNAKRNVTVLLDIDRALDTDWTFRITAGAWKRICLNIVSNALKYTPAGHINIVLRRHWLPQSDDEPRAAQVCLVVEDSGIGMSESFQAQNLFRPFRQENSLSQGTGLGLNLVAKLAKSEGGTVKVKSKQGTGTTVTITLPLQSSVPSASAVMVDNPEVNSNPFVGTLVSFLGFATSTGEAVPLTPQTDAKQRLANNLRDTCAQLGMKMLAYAFNEAGNPVATLRIIHELELQHLIGSNMDIETSAMTRSNVLDGPSIVICRSRASALRLRASTLHAGAGGTTQFLWQPVGPAKLAGAISACLTSVRRPSAVLIRRSSGAESVMVGETDSATVPGIAIASDRLTSDKNSPLRPVPSVAVRSEDDEVESASNQSLRAMTPVASLSSADLSNDMTMRATKHNSQSGPLSLLLVDDNHVNLRLLTVFATKAGYPHSTAQDGQEAVDLYTRSAVTDVNSNGASKPDVILMDINMPNLNGFEATVKIRQFEHESSIRRATIIALTGLGSKQAQERSFACGIDLFLTKPVRLKELGSILLRLREENIDREQ